MLLPILLLMLLGIIDTGMLLSTKSSVSYANRQAARFMEAYGASPSINPDPSILQAFTDAMRASNVDLSGLQSITFFKASTVAQAQSGDSSTDIVYPWSTSSMTFTAPITGVGATTLYTFTARSPGDLAGLTVRYRYSGFTPLFGNGFTFSDVTNIQIDPANGGFSLPTPIPTFTPLPANTATPYATQIPFTPLPTYTPNPTYTQPPTATPTNTATPTSTPTPSLSGSPATEPDLSVMTTTVNLSGAGTADWVHWAYFAPSDFDHKSGVTPQISTYTAMGSGVASRNNTYPVYFSWSGGTPHSSTPVNSPTNTGISIRDTSGIPDSTSDGFQFTVNVTDTATHTLRVYVGMWGGQGVITATLSNGASPLTYTDSSIDDLFSGGTPGSKNGVYTLTYNASSAPQTLTVRWIVLVDHCKPSGTNCGGSAAQINLKAATLQ